VLVLTRKEQEGIVISYNGVPLMRIAICAIRGDRVRVGVECPDKFLILRDEHFETRQEVDHSLQLEIKS